MATVEALATTYQLTGILNRQTSLRRLAVELDRAGRYDKPVTVCLADIDHFKKLNDTYGHAAGDPVLRHVAQLIRTNLRATDTVGRYGGEEFLIVLIFGRARTLTTADRSRSSRRAPRPARPIGSA